MAGGSSIEQVAAHLEQLRSEKRLRENVDSAKASDRRAALEKCVQDLAELVAGGEELNDQSLRNVVEDCRARVVAIQQEQLAKRPPALN